nr:unnamed protein product [Digitaria exilis]
MPAKLVEAEVGGQRAIEGISTQVEDTKVMQTDKARRYVPAEPIRIQRTPASPWEGRISATTRRCLPRHLTPFQETSALLLPPIDAAALKANSAASSSAPAAATANDETAGPSGHLLSSFAPPDSRKRLQQGKVFSCTDPAVPVRVCSSRSGGQGTLSAYCLLAKVLHFIGLVYYEDRRANAAPVKKKAADSSRGIKDWEEGRAVAAPEKMHN